MLSWGKDGLYEEWMIRWEPEVIYGMAADDSFLQDLQQQIHCNATFCKSCNSKAVAMLPTAMCARTFVNSAHCALFPMNEARSNPTHLSRKAHFHSAFQMKPPPAFYLSLYIPHIYWFGACWNIDLPEMEVVRKVTRMALIFGSSFPILAYCIAIISSISTR